MTFTDDSGTVRAIPPRRITDLMLELLELKPEDKLLEIGTGSGTQTHEFEQACKEIHTIELLPYWKCENYLGPKCYLHAGNGVKGIPSEAPFDAIVATCGVKQIPQAWIEQLKDGGRLVVPIGDPEGQRLAKFTKQGMGLKADRVAAYVRFSMLLEAA